MQQHMAQIERIQKIRSSVLQENEIISNLANTLSDTGLKEILKLASKWLGDVESFFLAKILQEPRTERALADWLGQAERLVQNAVQQRKFVEDIVKKYGQNARAIPT